MRLVPGVNCHDFNTKYYLLGTPDRKGNGSMIRVYTDMVADLFHYGHIEFLRQVSTLGDYVLVGINADDVAEAHKRRPVQTMEECIVSVGPVSMWTR